MDIKRQGFKLQLASKRPMTLKEFELNRMKRNSSGIVGRLKLLQKDRQVKQEAAQALNLKLVRSNSLAGKPGRRHNSLGFCPLKLPPVLRLPLHLLKRLPKVSIIKSCESPRVSAPSSRLDRLISDCRAESTSNKRIVRNIDRIHHQVMRSYKKAEVFRKDALL